MCDFHFFCPTKVHFGSGVSNRITRTLKQNDWQNVGLVVDHNLKEQPLINKLINAITSNSCRVVAAWCEISEPTYDDLDKMRWEFNSPNLQAVIGVGGGSTLDMAKAMAVLVHNKRPAIEYRGFDKMTKPVLPIIAVPTTAGTGSEITPNASFIDSVAKKKLGINGESIRPSFAFLDPDLTMSCPLEPTISAGLDSIVHAVEAFVAKKTNHLARFFATEGFRRVFRALPQVVIGLDNIELRQEVMYGAFISAVALMHSGTGPAAALSYPLSVYFRVPHGLGGGVFLPAVVEQNIRSGYSEYADLMDLGISDRAKGAERFLQEIKTTWKEIGIPDNLRTFGIEDADTHLIVKETMELKGALDQNPVPFNESAIADIISRLTGKMDG